MTLAEFLLPDSHPSTLLFLFLFLVHGAHVHFPPCSHSLSASWPSLPSQKPGSHSLPLISYALSPQVLLLLSSLVLSSLPAAPCSFLSFLSVARAVVLSRRPCLSLAPPVHLLPRGQSSLSETTDLIVLFPCIRPFSGFSSLARLHSNHSIKL